MKNSDTNTNPLLIESQLKNHAIAFDRIKIEHYMPALDAAIQQAKQNIDHIKSNKQPADFENTIVALETASEDVGLVSGVFFNMLSAEASDELQALAKDFSPKLSSFSSDISLDPQLFEKVKLVFDKKDDLQLNSEQMHLLRETYLGFTRNGALLDSKGQEHIREIDQRMSILSPQFSENVLKATNAFELHITDQTELAGLPESALNAAQHEAEEKQKSGWLFTLHAPSFIPFMTYCENRELRKKMWLAFNSKAFMDEFDNQKIVLEEVQLRYERAKLLGYKSHADFVLEERMAQSPEKVKTFLNELIVAAKPASLDEVKELSDFAKQKDGIDELQSWDAPYYIEKLKKQKFDFDEEELRPFFRLENVIDGVFKHAELLYDLKFDPTSDYPTYHPDVKVYEVNDLSTGKFIGLFYADFFPRVTKKGGAWMTNFHEQGLYKGEVIRPHVGIVCNFTKSTPKKPSLLTFMEVRTLFHEFGHALHGLLSQCTYKSAGGTNVFWDFVELPSQVMENWTLEKEGLDLFAKHYETGELIPEVLTQKIKASAQFMAGYYCLRQLNFGVLDMAWHGGNPSEIKDVAKFERENTQKTRLLPSHDGTLISTQFSHIFAGGYSSGYYSYKWAEVLDADAFEFFKEKGLFNKEVSRRFKNEVLSRGGVEHPMVLYKNFRGREPDPKALLRRDGLI